MPKYGYLVVEGPHDVEFVYRLLSPFGMSRVRLEKDLDPFFLPLIPRDFPPDGDLQKRVPIPLFLQGATHAIAVHSAAGETRLIETVEERSITIDYSGLTGIGILLDSDTIRSPAESVRHDPGRAPREELPVPRRCWGRLGGGTAARRFRPAR